MGDEEKVKEQTIKQLNEEEIKKLKKVVEDYNKYTYQIGNKALLINRIKSEKDDLIEKYIQVAQNESEILKEIENKYGKGQLNLKDWTITIDSK